MATIDDIDKYLAEWRHAVKAATTATSDYNTHPTEATWARAKAARSADQAARDAVWKAVARCH